MSAAKTPPQTHDQLNARMTDYAESIGVGMNGIVMSCCPGNYAPIMIVGYRHLPGEASPFDATHRAIVITLLQQLAIKPHMVFITDLVKAPIVGDTIDPKVLARWGNFLFEQIQIVEPKAVILLGAETAKVVIRVDRPAVQDYRHTRFVWPQRTPTNFFVTYGPDDVAKETSVGFGKGMLGMKQAAIHEDIKAVAEADITHFDRIFPVAGFSQE